MKMKKLTINKGCIVIGTVFFLLSLSTLFTVYRLSHSARVLFCVIIYTLGSILCAAVFLMFVRRKLTLFSDVLCRLLDDMMSSETDLPQYEEEESLFYKIQHRIFRLYEVLRESKCSVAKERTDLQELISDISHQVKTPIANLKIIDATLLEQTVAPEKQKEFLLAIDGQLNKLDFLMQSMVKTSRLEAGAIVLEPRPQMIYDTLAAALGDILFNAEKKSIEVTVNCPANISAIHDRKWTREALFNILDNAVKYTPAGGKISVSVVSWEVYVKIDIADTGIGISEQHQGTIFRRFYREETVHDIEGIGIGLYLAREIITRQYGFIRVASEVGKGSIFSVFLPQHEIL